MQTFKKLLPVILIVVLEIALGVLLITNAEALTEMAFRITGIGLVILAIVLVIRYLSSRKEGTQKNISLIAAIIYFVVGMVLAFGAEAIVEAGSMLVAIFYGAVMMVSGIFRIVEYVSQKKQGVYVPGMLILSGVLAFGLGIVAIIFCTKALQVVGIIVGVTLIIDAVLDIISLIVGYHMNKGSEVYETTGKDLD